MVVVGILDSLVAALESESLVGENHLALAVVDLDDLDFHLVADMELCGQIQVVVIGILLAGQDPVRLVVNVKDRFLGLNIDYRTFDHLSCMNCSK